MKKLMFCLGLVLSSGSAAHAGLPPEQGTSEQRTASATRIATVLKVLPSKCPSDLKAWNDPLSARTESLGAVVVASIGGAVIEKVVDYGSEYLKSREAKLTASSTARDNIDMYRTEVEPAEVKNRCIVLARGKIGPDAAFKSWKAEQDRLPQEQQDTYWKDRVNILREQSIPLVGSPLMYSEFSINYDSTSAASTAWLQMNFLDYKATAAKRAGSGSKDLIFTFVFEAPGDIDDKNAVKKYARFDVTLPGTPIGTRWGKDTLADRVSTVQRLPPNRASADAPLSAVKTSVLGTLTETEDSGDIELAVANAVENNKAQIAAALTDELKKLLGVETKTDK